MEPVLKLLLFFSLFGVVFISGFKTYRFFNNKIMNSRNGWELLGFSLLLIAVNALLFFGGLFALIKAYSLLASNQ